MTTLLDMINAAGGEVPEIGPIAGNKTVRAKIVRLEKRVTKADDGEVGKEYLQATLTLPEEPTADDLRQFVSFMPGPENTEKDNLRILNNLMKFYKCFDLPLDLEFSEGDNPQALGAVAKEGYIIVGLRAKRNGDGNENFVIQYIVPEQ